MGILRVLVTGALGFIGHRLCKHLVKQSFEVFGVDNLSRGRAERVQLLRECGVSVGLIDVRDYEALTDFMARVKPDAVVHLAALISVEESFKKPLLYEDVNVRGTITTVLASNKAGVQRFIYVSSAAVYGDPRYLPIDESHPTEPLSPYGATKLAGEYFSKTLFRGDRRVLILRLFNVYGPGQNPEYAGVIARFMERLAAGKPPVIYGDGEQTRDFIHIDDVVRAIERALAVELNEHVTLNIGTGRPTTINELAHRMIRAFNINTKPIYAPPREGDIRHSYADVTKAKKLLGWEPTVGLDEGLKQLINSV